MIPERIKRIPNMGFSIVELMVSMVIVAFVVITIMRVFTYSAQTLKRSRVNYGAAILAENESERLKFMALCGRMPEDTLYLEVIDNIEYEIKRKTKASDTISGFCNTIIVIKDVVSDTTVFKGAYMVPGNDKEAVLW